MIDKTAKIHSHALVEDGATIGGGTRIWAFSHVLPGARIGADCNICDHTFIENDVRLGDRVTVKCGVHLWDGLVVEDDVFIGPSAVFTNDPRPRSRKYPEKFCSAYVQRGCTVGANATILPGITLGEWSMIGAGAVVTRDVPRHALVAGVPAHIVGWVCRCGVRLRDQGDIQQCDECGLGYMPDSDGFLYQVQAK